MAGQGRESISTGDASSDITSFKCRRHNGSATPDRTALANKKKRICSVHGKPICSVPIATQNENLKASSDTEDIPHVPNEKKPFTEVEVIPHVSYGKSSSTLETEDIPHVPGGFMSEKKPSTDLGVNSPGSIRKRPSRLDIDVNIEVIPHVPNEKKPSTDLEIIPPISNGKRRSMLDLDVSHHVTFAPIVANRIVLEIEGTRIFQTTLPSLTLYQLSHAITWKSEDKFEGLTLNAMAQIPYIQTQFDSPHRICDIETIDEIRDDLFPQALLRSPPWGLRTPIMKFSYESNGRVMGICEIIDPCEIKETKTNIHSPSLVMAAGVLGTDKATLHPSCDYPNGEYRVQWLQCQGERVTAMEKCDLVQGDNGRLRRRYRLSWNGNEVQVKKDVDLLVACWSTRVWLEEVFLKAMEKDHEERVKKKRRGSRRRMSRFGWKLVSLPGRICCVCCRRRRAREKKKARNCRHCRQ